MSWKGNIGNPSPNEIQEPIERSEKIIDDNRALQVRRDTDDQKNFTITLLDIDETILLQLEQLQLQVEDVGKQVKVPVFYGSPERWVSAQRDGYLRDKQGKVLLPALILKRTNSENDASLQFFNRYLNTPVMKLYSPKNRYTRFSTLMGKNTSVHEVYNVIVPSHMILTYHFIIWTAYVEQMNKLVETIQFNTKDYWGSKKGFRFRTRVESYGHTVELQANEDRIVKTEFDLVTHGYILPDSMTKLDRHMMTTEKYFTPKKIVMGLEVVATDYDWQQLDTNRQKWQNPNYPNLQADVNIPSPPVSVDTRIVTGIVGIKVDNSPLFLRIVPVPLIQDAGGQDGDMSYDSEYFYLHTNHKWRRVAIVEFTPTCSDNVPITGNDGSTSFNTQFFYIYSKGKWRKVALNSIRLSIHGSEGDVMYDAAFLYIYTGGAWRQVAISLF